MEEKYQFIVGYLGSVEIPQEQIAAFVSISDIHSYARGDHFVRVGDNSDLIGIVVSGLLRAAYLTEDGKNLIRKFYKAKDLMGPFATALAQEPAHVTIDAIEDSRVLQMRYSAFATLREQHPCWERLNRILLERNYVQRERRAFQLLAFDATERYRLFQAEYADISERIAKSDVASYLGISPESLSRIIHRK